MSVFQCLWPVSLIHYMSVFQRLWPVSLIHYMSMFQRLWPVSLIHYMSVFQRLWPVSQGEGVRRESGAGCRRLLVDDPAVSTTTGFNPLTIISCIH